MGAASLEGGCVRHVHRELESEGQGRRIEGLEEALVWM